MVSVGSTVYINIQSIHSMMYCTIWLYASVELKHALCNHQYKVVITSVITPLRIQAAPGCINVNKLMLCISQPWQITPFALLAIVPGSVKRELAKRSASSSPINHYTSPAKPQVTYQESVERNHVSISLICMYMVFLIIHSIFVINFSDIQDIFQFAFLWNLGPTVMPADQRKGACHPHKE